MEDKHKNDQHHKASLRGKGREIFFGAKGTDANAQADVSAETAPDLTVDESAALQDLLAEPSTVPPVSSAEPLPYPDEANAAASLERQDALPLGERVPNPPAAEPSVPSEPPHPDVQALEPEMPEVWSGESTPPETVAVVPNGDEGGLAPLAEGQLTWEDPFAHRGQRPEADQLFPETETADPALLYMLVDDEHIRQLFTLIEQLLDELVTGCRAPSETLDAYQKDLLHANSLLLASRENYDDARAIAYRVRGEINRQRQIEADIKRYRPLLLNYYLGWGVTLVVLFLLKALFVGVAEAVGVNALSALYYPALFGVAGALLSGFFTLDRHTSILRDFDPMHITWYLLNPLLGGVMGVLMFLLIAIANEDLLSGTASFSEVIIADLLCLAAGMNQSYVLRRLDELRQRYGGTAEARDANNNAPPAPPQSK